MAKDKFKILGTFTGECADADITNNNGLDITREVWQSVFSSDIYKKGIELGHYIGFLGHPDKPDCQDFEKACIVMTNGYLDSNGKVYGTFNLIDTPVGRVVKSFIDAGVQFGISVRGVGDIEANSVVPGTFDFRGFDLVAFPAYPDSIPVFEEIAASTDAKSQMKYKNVCKAVDDNIDMIDDIQSLEFMKSQFAKQSNQYKNIEARQMELRYSKMTNSVDINQSRIDGLIKLNVEASAQIKALIKENKKLKSELQQSAITASRKLNSMKRFTESQYSRFDDEYNDLCDEYEVLDKRYVEACRKLSTSNNKIHKLEKDNLIYQQKIEANSKELSQNASTIERLHKKLNETVEAANDVKAQTSNRDEVIASLKAQLKDTQSDLEAATTNLNQFQRAYADLYASAVGVGTYSLPITAATSVAELKQSIGSAQIHSANDSNYDDDVDIIDIADDSYDSGLITL